MKRIVSLICAVSMLFSLCVISADAYNDSESTIRIPDSITWFGNDPTSQSDESQQSDNELRVQPRILFGYTYMNDDSAAMGSTPTKDLFYEEIVTRAVSFPEGANVTFIRGLSAETTTTTSWDIAASVTFPIKEVEIALTGEYRKSKTVKINASEEWKVEYTIPGQYIATWYVIGHKYPVTGNCKISSSDGNDGKIQKMIMGYITIPTNGVNLDIT